MARRNFSIVPLLLMAILLWVAAERTPAAPARITGAPLVYVRKGPGTGFDPAGVLSAGANVNTVETTGSWTKIRTADGQTGFVHSSYLSLTPSAAAEEPPPVAPPADPGPVIMQSAAATEPEPTRDQIATEIEKLRLEITDLKRKIEERSTDGNGLRALSERAAGTDPAASRPAMAPAGGTSPPGDPNVRVVAIGIAALLVGWVLGAIFSRRRSRAQRNRLRF